jgi:uncharacterized membrane protein
VVVRKPVDKLKVKQVVSLVGVGALDGAFWGIFIGLLFWMPWLGLAIGAATGVLSGKLSDFGIDDDFIKQVGATVEPGHSDLFLLVEKWIEDKVLKQTKDFDATVLRTSLSKEDEARLVEAFGAGE